MTSSKMQERFTISEDLKQMCRWEKLTTTPSNPNVFLYDSTITKQSQVPTLAAADDSRDVGSTSTNSDYKFAPHKRQRHNTRYSGKFQDPTITKEAQLPTRSERQSTTVTRFAPYGGDAQDMGSTSIPTVHNSPPHERLAQNTQRSVSFKSSSTEGTRILNEFQFNDLQHGEPHAAPNKQHANTHNCTQISQQNTQPSGSFQPSFIPSTDIPNKFQFNDMHYGEHATPTKKPANSCNNAPGSRRSHPGIYKMPSDISGNFNFGTPVNVSLHKYVRTDSGGIEVIAEPFHFDGLKQAVDSVSANSRSDTVPDKPITTVPIKRPLSPANYVTQAVVTKSPPAVASIGSEHQQRTHISHRKMLRPRCVHTNTHAQPESAIASIPDKKERSLKSSLKSPSNRSQYNTMNSADRKRTYSQNQETKIIQLETIAHLPDYISKDIGLTVSRLSTEYSELRLHGNNNLDDHSTGKVFFESNSDTAVDQHANNPGRHMARGIPFYEKQNRHAKLSASETKLMSEDSRCAIAEIVEGKKPYKTKPELLGEIDKPEAGLVKSSYSISYALPKRITRILGRAKKLQAGAVSNNTTSTPQLVAEKVVNDHSWSETTLRSCAEDIMESFHPRSKRPVRQKDQECSGSTRAHNSALENLVRLAEDTPNQGRESPFSSISRISKDSSSSSASESSIVSSEKVSSSRPCVQNFPTTSVTWRCTQRLWPFFSGALILLLSLGLIITSSLSVVYYHLLTQYGIIIWWTLSIIIGFVLGMYGASRLSEFTRKFYTATSPNENVAIVEQTA